ncbi:MAG: hypothetical protein KDB80_02600, partial [Planctomycetes bacterium]|nr:hypothetical protein [Planctomycetota bacterium]
MKALTLLTSAALLAGALAPAAMADGRKPGSVLVYPVHRSGISMFTILCVTNTNTQPATPTSFGGSINLHFEYVNVTPNAADAFKPLGCTIFDRIEFLTPADTLCVLTSCHNASAPGGQEGYVVVSAERPDEFRQKVSHDFLIGSEMVVNGAGAVYGINAIPFESRTGGNIGAPADGMIKLDGADYEEAPDVLMIDSYLAVAGSQLALLNLGGTHRDCNDVYFSVWNDNERALSATLRFNCWFDQPLTAVSPLFAESFLVSIPNDPAELDINCDGIGDLETGWATIQSRG